MHTFNRKGFLTRRVELTGNNDEGYNSFTLQEA